MVKIGIIGAGNMGGAIAGGLCARYDVAVCEQDQQRLKSLRRRYRIQTGDLASVVKASKAVILAVKPQDFDFVLAQARPYIQPRQVVISIAAGLTCDYIEQRLNPLTRVVRVMPNLPAQIGRAMTALCAGKHARKTDLSLARKLFDCVGKTVTLEERWMDSVTAASGSGPAYVFLFLEYFLAAVRALGVPDELAKILVDQTVQGSLELVKGRGEDAASWRARVTSKGGTTQAAMDVFEKHETGKIFQAALAAARQRAKELSK